MTFFDRFCHALQFIQTILVFEKRLKTAIKNQDDASAGYYRKRIESEREVLWLNCKRMKKDTMRKIEEAARNVANRYGNPKQSCAKVFREYRRLVPQKEHIIKIEDAVLDYFQPEKFKKEFTGEGMIGRCDLLMFKNGELAAVEIKSEKDTLDRLYGQAIENFHIFDRSLVVVHEKHYARFKRMRSAFSAVGIYVFGENGIEKASEGWLNPYPTMPTLLWKEELLRIIAGKKMGAKNLSKMTRGELFELCKNSLSLSDFVNSARKEIVNRNNFEK